MANEVKILPMTGPISTAKVSPSDSSPTAYTMNVSGQKSIAIINATSVAVYLAGDSATELDGFPLISKGSSVVIDVMDGTIIYMMAAGAGADVRVMVCR